MPRPDRRDQIELVLFDVDGVLTDGTLLIGPEGEALKPFNVRDGVAIGLLRQHGIKSGVLSAKSSQPLMTRATQLGMDVIKIGFSRKLEAIQQIAEEQGIAADRIAFAGDDVIDIPVMREVAAAYAPADAHPLVLDAADYVTKAEGGRGVAREIAEDLLSARGLDLAGMYAHLLGDDEALRRIVQ
ncbi:MAG: 3-deoxy-D-manno-octulosonate 8-phosphate phosphatase [Salinicola sp.]|uniref:KdsC family phosphatase n=1 Tax=uncultured Salinicola sp. TaxID=1193542 RepID=UPI000C97BF38|nr:HAD hydrolase family protein [uncultured Salinicola sp.]MAM58884.1 3-deoxy-D-manno-octulosonate 8-phosphate phosphatase [Salinicola sp.]